MGAKHVRVCVLNYRSTLNSQSQHDHGMRSNNSIHSSGRRNPPPSDCRLFNMTRIGWDANPAYTTSSMLKHDSVRKIKPLYVPFRARCTAMTLTIHTYTSKYILNGRLSESKRLTTSTEKEGEGKRGRRRCGDRETRTHTHYREWGEEIRRATPMLRPTTPVLLNSDVPGMLMYNCKICEQQNVRKRRYDIYDIQGASSRLSPPRLKKKRKSRRRGDWYGYHTYVCMYVQPNV